MPARLLILTLAVILLAGLFAGAPAVELHRQAFQMREDFGVDHLSDCYMQYYYYVPCPTYSWFMAIYNWGMVLGVHFQIGDISMGTGEQCDPLMCYSLDKIRILDFWGYGTVYPGFDTIEFDVYCSDEKGCPVGPSLWNSGPYETTYGWNYVDVAPPLCLTDCSIETNPVPSAPRILVMAKQHGSYPQWGLDQVDRTVRDGCELHDISSLPMLYPRPYSSHYETVHTGYYGQVGYAYYFPPLWFCDWPDTSEACDQYGYVELAWRIYLICNGPSDIEPSTWGSIKSMYR